jgi:oxalate decarboxylase/phosphoglucose isomerase-like protein (cupin superfamily)
MKLQIRKDGMEMGKELPKIIRVEEGTSLELPGGGYGRRMVSSAVSKKLGMGIIYVDRGKSPHRWHNHDSSDRGGTYQVYYPKGFEEAYLVVQGEGVLQWKVKGKVSEKKVKAGDAAYFPPGVVESQLLNKGAQPLIVVYACTPPVKAKK